MIENNKLRSYFTIKDIVIILGILFAILSWYFKTGAAVDENISKIKTLQEIKLDKEIYEIQKRNQDERTKRLEESIRELTIAVNQLNTNLAKLKR